MHIKKERKCVACRSNKQQNEMIRVARVNAVFEIDFSHKLGGRGAYVCNNPQCINTAIKKKLFNKSFKTNVDPQIYVKLGEYEKDC